MLTIRPARDSDRIDISVVVSSAFEQPNEIRLIEALRRDDAVAMELVALEAGGMAGHILFSWLPSPVNWLAMAPLSVRQARQNRGIGAELVRYGLDAARRQRAAAVVVVGDPAYYRRFGFVFGGWASLRSPYPEKFTGLYPIALGTAQADAVLVYPQPFEVV